MTSITLSEIHEADQRIRPEARVTPVVRALTEEGDGISLKCESLQNLGAFKIRGALNALRQFSHSDRERGVIAESSGNHALAIAFAAAKMGIAAHIIMPKNAPEIKVQGVERLGATIYRCDPTEDARRTLRVEIQERIGGVLVHPFNDERVIAGQGTVGLEILNQIPSATTIVVPIGGGGLISGISTAVREQRPGVRIIGVEPEGAADTLLSLQAGVRTSIPGGGQSIAEGLLSTVGEIPFKVIQHYVHEIVTVSDVEIAAATMYLFERTKLVVEPSGATAFAAAMFGRCGAIDPNTVVVLTGGNVDLRRFPELRELAGR